MNLIYALKESKVKDLVVASTTTGLADLAGKMEWGLTMLVKTKQIKRMITSYIG